MIYFHAAPRFLWTINRFIDGWAPQLRDRVRPVAYSDIRLDRPIPAGVHIFTDFERLLPMERRFVRQLGRMIDAHPNAYAALNRPNEWVGRFDLLDRLADAETNQFRAHRLRDAGPHVRFPAFVRWENDHRGSLGASVGSVDEARERVEERVTGRRKLLTRHLMLVEKVDVKDDDGLFRKYSVMRVGKHLVPRHILFSKEWVTKKPDIVTPELAREEQLFLDELPHAEQIGRIFDLAGVTYGRIDYGFRDGRMQVWEINSNPVVVPLPGAIDPLRLEGQTRSAGLIAEALESLDEEQSIEGGEQRIGWPNRLWMGPVAKAGVRFDSYRR